LDENSKGDGSMKKNICLILFLLICFFTVSIATAGPAGTAIREAAEYIVKKFGKGAGGQTVEEVTDATTRAITKYGDDALPILKKTGHAGFSALEQAGNKAPDIIKLYARKGDEAIWIISQPKKLSIFLKHGDSAADALLKHPGIADSLITKYGDDAAGALNNLSRASAQKLNRIADEGILDATKQSPELLSVVRKYGDEAMDFIWKNKGALTVASVLGTFLHDPGRFIGGEERLPGGGIRRIGIIDRILGPIADNANWTLIIIGILCVGFMPFIARKFKKSYSEIKKASYKNDEKDYRNGKVSVAETGTKPENKVKQTEKSDDQMIV